MQIQITPDQCHCSFGDGIVYEFVPTNYVPHLKNCILCAFWPYVFLSNTLNKCFIVPCQKGLRKDEIGGFWRISQLTENQLFKKLASGRG